MLNESAVSVSAVETDTGHEKTNIEGSKTMTLNKVAVFSLVALLSVAVTAFVDVAGDRGAGVAYAQNEADGNNNQNGTDEPDGNNNQNGIDEPDGDNNNLDEGVVLPTPTPTPIPATGNRLTRQRVRRR